MKKRTALLFTLTAAASWVFSGSLNAAPNAAEQYVGEAKARAVALENAGVTEEQVIFIKTHLDHDDGRVVYDVEFYSGNTEYDYEIDAVSGVIVEYDKDIEYYSIPAVSSDSGVLQDYIGEERARAVSLENAGVTAEQATFIKTHLDHDNGRVVYDVEFFAGNTEYDYEIDALSGEIIEYDYEIEYRAAAVSSADVIPAQASATGAVQYIGEDRAIAIALADAGIAQSEVRRMDIDLDREHGVMVYEIEFKSGQKEYEYEINAADGTMLKSKVEFDD